MNRFITCFFALVLCAPAVGADVTPARVIPTAPSDGASSRAVARGNDATTVSRATSSRTVVGENSSPRADAENASVSRMARGDASRTTVSARTINVATPVSTSNKSSRAAANVRNAQSANLSARDKLNATVNIVGRNPRTQASSINNDPAVRRAGLVLRPTSADSGIHVPADAVTADASRNATRTVSARAAVTSESIAAAKELMDQTSQLNKSCQEQYNDCMDQFCAVIDANQKRCSCSANLSKYTKVEEAVKDANVQLNDVAQRIRYVGLSADEIRAIMTATEAENALTGAKDTTETRSLLQDIEDLIKDPSSSSSYSGNTFGTLDLNLDFSTNNADMFNLDFLNTDTTSFSNLRGTDLYNAAKKRCNSVLTQCKDAGATTQQITANYDLAIDKDCIAYEQGLTKMNETLATNVRSATLMLQKARLAVQQNKNQYDAKDCIAALDTCMTDDMVCGDNYTKCLDPTKRYIDENGKVVLGQDITNITDFMHDYESSLITSDFLGRADSVVISTETCQAVANRGECMVKYLLGKIGTGQKVTDNGLCRAVLDKCQNYTYLSSGTYNPYNDVVLNYIQRAMVNIKSAQQQIISDYASTCMVDIASCYNQQVTQVNAWSSNASVSAIRNVMRGACRNVAMTCAYAVFAADNDSCDPTKPDDTCIENISQMFYQSMLCPDNSSYIATKQTPSTNGTHAGYVSAHCQCREGYRVYGATCVACPQTGYALDAYGRCVENTVPDTPPTTETEDPNTPEKIEILDPDEPIKKLE